MGGSTYLLETSQALLPLSFGRNGFGRHVQASRNESNVGFLSEDFPNYTPQRANENNGVRTTRTNWFVVFEDHTAKSQRKVK
jgi:hypothetical protein